tara:strand:+ start:1214 stop:1852 length:639 start_codon:yes stop_codon:yes gene_type:complete
MPRFHTTIWSDLSAARTGEDSAVRALVDRYRPPLVAYLRSRGAGDEAEDLAQEVFLRFFSRGLLEAAERSNGRFRSYLLAVTSHVITDWRRRRSTLKRGGRESPVSLDAIAEPAADESFDNHWLLNLIQRALAVIAVAHPVHHQLLVGVSEGHSPAELARSLGKDPGALRVALHRARKRLADHLCEEVAAYCSSEEEYREEIALVLGRAGIE